jgi:hypothetical protein
MLCLLIHGRFVPLADIVENMFIRRKAHNEQVFPVTFRTLRLSPRYFSKRFFSCSHSRPNALQSPRRSAWSAFDNASRAPDVGA